MWTASSTFPRSSVAAAVADTVTAGGETGASGRPRRDPGPGHSEPGDRGRLVVADRVLERIATIAAGEVSGVVSAGTGVDQLLGRRDPKADASVAGGRARIHLDLAVAWPNPLAQVTADVRQRVQARVSGLVGLAVDAVDVTAALVVHAPQLEPRRVQ